jgi:uncharacterized protein
LSDILRSLLALQKLDDTLLDLERQLHDIPAQIQALEKLFEEEARRLEGEKKRLKEAALQQRGLDKQLEEGADQLKKKEVRKVEVKTNEEYWALLKEIDFVKDANVKTEDAVLQLLDEVEGLEKAIRLHEREIQQKEMELRSEKDRLERQRLEIDREHQEARDTRRRLSEELPPETLAAYEKIRTQRSRQAVVIVQGEVCPGCHMRIPPQTINEVLLTGEIRHCPYCRRILYCELAEQSL